MTFMTFHILGIVTPSDYFFRGVENHQPDVVEYGTVSKMIFQNQFEALYFPQILTG